MPDVTRSDSQRSDVSNRPRVSFNRDVHVKRIGVLPEKFYTLPNRRKQKPDFISSSLDRRLRRNSLEPVPPKKPPRTFATLSTPHTTQKTSIFDIFKKSDKKDAKKSNLRRSVSDATNLKSKAYGSQGDLLRKRSGSDSEEVSPVKSPKKQLSPIIEVTQRDDYFSKGRNDDKENILSNDNVSIKAPARRKCKKSESVTEKLKEYINEVDEEIFKETGVRVAPPEDIKEPEIIIIDVDKAEKITNNKQKTSLGKKLKSLTQKKNKSNEAKNKNQNKKAGKPKEILNEELILEKPKLEEKLSAGSNSASPRIKEAIENLENSGKRSPNMIHSSQKPADKLPLTKGRTVDHMVKRLSTDSASPPPKTNILISPNVSMQHNNNQPFSYTRGISPEKYMSNENLPNPSSPIIYAQVVCGKNGTSGPTKQTVHTAYQNGKKHPHSDSDEGLGYEENTGFNREKTITHFGDDRFNDSFRKTEDFFDEVDKFAEETPITPKFTNPAFINGYSGDYRKVNSYSRQEHTGYIDSSSRGRGDGMDAKRRESLTEQFENGFGTPNGNGRSDLSARRDLLESRINRRLNDSGVRHSPEYPSQTPTHVYVTESSSKYYRSGSISPVGYKEKYVSETRTDKNGERRTTESRSKRYFGDHPERHTSKNYQSFDNEPKSFDSQISDYRSSPENRQFEASHNRYNARSDKQKIFKDRDYYKSTPEIHHQDYADNYRDSYHDSLRRERHENRLTSSSRYRSERYLDHSENERKDKFGDSGIENDFRRDSGENWRASRPPRRREYCNESEDEGFASSLLIASERQHTEDNINGRKKKDYDSDRAYSKEDDPYRHLEHLDYKMKLKAHDYVPRERSIDDGSHFDPRIDKGFDRNTLKKVEKKPPKPEKKSNLEKMKSLFTRDSKKKKEKLQQQQHQNMVREESLRARYVEYKGRDNEPKYKKKEMNDENSSYDYSNRRRLSTPSPSPTRETTAQRNEKPAETTHGSWFKSLDRLSRKKTKKDERDGNLTSTEEDSPLKPTPTKNLRFFGDTDIESNDSTRHRSTHKHRPGILGRDRVRSQSTRDLHNISEELRSPDLGAKKTSHKSMTNITEAECVKSSLKPPMSPNHRVREDTKGREDRNRRRKNEVSSVESSTEGDSSQQSQRSIVYLHAATVGDIPGPGYLRNGRRAASREELASNSSSRIQHQEKTLSRSFSVLAPWKPRHYREAMDIDYTQYPKQQVKNGKYEQKITKNGSSRKENSSTLKKKAQETKRNQNMSTLTRKSKSKENLASQNFRKSNGDLSKGSSSTLYKKKDKLPRENSRYSRGDRDEKKIASKSLSVESLGSNSRSGRSRDERDISRSVSMPRDPEKSAGWFKMSKKPKHSASAQRL
ncbi:uncharacterized protein LOC109609226 isoform X3 [Aethina tumida]|uniref:uncharacterized protein LOC109609226 isoform X3 n=1 Tax=Aethina tumida TaxID=116153 RepID=UPI002148706D|nr:uncharacterized protein LOC109609226 isoform X3 [Aethina tumida]